MPLALRTRSSSTIAAVLMLAASASAASYTTTNLTPTGANQAQANAVLPGQQAGFATFSDGNPQAYVWTGVAPGTNVHPASDGAPGSVILALSATEQVGYVQDSFTSYAALWAPASATPFQRLNATGYSASQATGISGGNIVGFGGGYALLWTDPSTAPTNLQPASPTYNASSAFGISGNYVVGSASLTATSDPHAALWDLSTSSFYDIHPATGFVQSVATAVSGTQVAGYGLQDDSVASPNIHALLWTIGVGDSTTVTDLNPAGFDLSVLTGTNGSEEVGYAAGDDGYTHAMLWNGTADSALDLSQYLPAGLYQSSEALGIDSAGDIVGYATDFSGDTYAILWTPSATPEPASAMMLGLPAALALLGRRRKSPGYSH